MTAVQTMTRAFTHWNDFSSRSSRTEYWAGFFAVLVVTFVTQFILLRVLAASQGPEFLALGRLTDENPGIGLVLNLSVALICFFMLPLTARRFHDHGWRGRWFSWMRWPAYALAMIATAALGLSVLGDSSNLMTLTLVGFALAFPPYLSVIWCFWIGFLKPDPNTNQYGPNPHEVTT